MPDPETPRVEATACPDLDRIAAVIAATPRQGRSSNPHPGDPGIDDEAGKKLPFAKVITAAAPLAKTLAVGDTDHFNAHVRGIMGKTENLDAFKAAGGKHIIVETGLDVQDQVKAYNAGSLTKDQLNLELHQRLKTSQGNEDGTWTRQLTSMAEYGRGNGIALNIDYTGYKTKPNQEQCNTSAYMMHDINEAKKRFDDKPLAERINNLDGKVMLQIGHFHFSASNGSRDVLKDGLVKVDVYESEDEMHASLARHAGFRQTIGLTAYKPDLVYFQDTGTVHTTSATSPALRAAIEAAAAAPQPATLKPQRQPAEMVP